MVSMNNTSCVATMILLVTPICASCHFIVSLLYSVTYLINSLNHSNYNGSLIFVI